jgi:hypothetical protein
LPCEIYENIGLVFGSKIDPQVKSTFEPGRCQPRLRRDKFTEPFKTEIYTRLAELVLSLTLKDRKRFSLDGYLVASGRSRCVRRKPGALSRLDDQQRVCHRDPGAES